MPDHSSEFEELFISPVLLAGLYGNSLVILDDVAVNRGAPAVAETKKTPAIQTIKAVAAGLPNEQQEASANRQPAIQFLGGFAKKIAVLVNDTGNPHLGETEFELLVKMLQAVKCSMADVALINIFRNPVQWSLIEQQLAAEKAIFFGVDPFSLGVPMRIPQFRVHRWGNTTFLCSPSLTALNNVSPAQTQLKKDLWEALKEMFS